MRLRSDDAAMALGDSVHPHFDVPQSESGASCAQVPAGACHALLLRSDGVAILAQASRRFPLGASSIVARGHRGAQGGLSRAFCAGVSDPGRVPQASLNRHRTGFCESPAQRPPASPPQKVRDRRRGGV